MSKEPVQHNPKVMKKKRKPHNFVVIKRRKQFSEGRFGKRFDLVRTAASAAANLLRHMRCRATMTQKELAERIGTTQPAISRAESGAVYPDLEMMERIALVCGFALKIDAHPAPFDAKRLLQYSTPTLEIPQFGLKTEP